MSRVLPLVAAMILLVAAAPRGWPADEREVTPHMEQTLWLEQQPVVPTEDALEAARLEAEGKLFPSIEKPAVRATAPRISRDFITFGYLQSEDMVFHIRWHAMTHLGSRFVSFNSDGVLVNPSIFTGRSPYLRAGGAAEAAGVKMIAVILNQGFDVSVINTVMTDPARRQTLINELVNLVTNDDYCHGVSFDFEPFSWTSSARNGMTQFFADLRAAFDAVDPSLEISVYTAPSPSDTQWDIPNMHPNLDYIIFSGYSWDTTSTPSAISRFQASPGVGYLNRINEYYLPRGLPPEKMVVALSSYSRRWSDVTAYGQNTGTNRTSQGFTDGLYDITVNPNHGGPYIHNYTSPHEAGWHTWNNGTTDFVRTWEALEGVEYKLRHVLSNQHSGNVYNGQRLGGVAYWSLMWLAETSSAIPPGGGTVSRTRTYPHIYQAMQEILSPPGTTRFLIEGYEGLDFRWRQPTESPDTTGVSSATREIVAAPGGAGAPDDTTNAMRINFNFQSAAGNKVFFRHEPLANPVAPSLLDTNAMAAHFDANTRVSAYIHTPAAYAGRTLRMVVMDANRQLEMSNAHTLNASGWRLIEWDLTDASQINGYTTSEPAFLNGNGVINTAGGGARDIAFVGFLIEGGGASGSGQVVIDEVSYERAYPGGREYKINEFRYGNTSQEFVEIYGPAGAFPSGLQLRFFDSADGSVLKSFALSGSIADAGGGFGYWVIGDPGVPNVNSSTGFSAGVGDIPRSGANAMQIYNPNTGAVYDSVVYQAWGGLGDLIRLETLGVTGEGYPWIGRVGPGGNASGATYTMGRYPDGADSNVNHDDFSFMPPTPGAPNGNSLTLPVTFDFETAPATPFKTFQDFTVSDPVAAGLPPSPSGGNAHRSVDTAGGGVLSVFGDASLGAGGAGYTVTGELYIPSGAEPAQAIGIGIAARQGAAFFSDSNNILGYDDGYWVIYENTSGIGLNNGRPDHPGVIEFLRAHNTNMSSDMTTFLSSESRSSMGIPNGGWTNFYMSINPGAAPGWQLLVALNDEPLYQGPIPDGGPTSGAFAVGFRENHPGGPAANEGAWVDNLRISNEMFEAVNITTHPQSETVATDDPVTFTVVAEGTGQLFYQWFKDNDEIIGATGSSYTINNVSTGDAGDYRVEVWNAFTDANSNTATLTVDAAAVDAWLAL